MVKILVVEDDRAINGLICSCLRGEGYETTACYDGEAGLNAFVEGSYALVISDIMMPKMDGFALAEEIRLFNNTPQTTKCNFRVFGKSYVIGFGKYEVKTLGYEVNILLEKGFIIK